MEIYNQLPTISMNQSGSEYILYFSCTRKHIILDRTYYLKANQKVLLMSSEVLINKINISI
jgi:hypothetical protein